MYVSMPRLGIVRGLILWMGLAVIGWGCSNPKKKAKKTLQQSVEACRQSKAQKTFYTVEAFGGIKRDILRRTCEESLRDFEMPDNFSARAKVGPYTWTAGIEKETGLWVLKDVRWPTLDNARDRLNTEDPSVDALERTVELLGKAQETYGESGWIRLRRLETMLDVRSEKMGGDEDLDPIELGSQAQTQFQETLTWAQDNDRRDVEAKARLLVSDYLRSYINRTRSAKSSLGSQDEWYQNAIEQARDKGNDQQAQKYEKTLETLEDKRPQKRERYNRQIESARVALCRQYADLTPSGIEDNDLKKRVNSAESTLDCATILDEADETRDSKGSSQ